MEPTKELEQVGASGPQERRGTEHVPLIRPCPYELSTFPGGETVELSDGLALSLNISSDGMMLLMSQAPSEGQVFNVQAPSLATPEVRTHVVEVRWTRELPLGVDPGTYLVGVRFLFEVPASSTDNTMAL